MALSGAFLHIMCHRQAIVAGEGIVFYGCPYVRYFVLPFVRLLPNLWTLYFENKWTDFNANWRKWTTEQRRETVNFGGQEVKDRRHTRPKLDLEAWRRHNSLSFWVEYLFQLFEVYNASTKFIMGLIFLGAKVFHGGSAPYWSPPPLSQWL